LVHEVSGAEELAVRRHAQRVDHAGLEVEDQRVGRVLATRGLVVNTLMLPNCASLLPQYSPRR
jgi:hypothetical protein